MEAIENISRVKQTINGKYDSQACHTRISMLRDAVLVRMNPLS